MTTSFAFIAGAIPGLALGAQSIALSQRALDETSIEGTFVGTLSVANSADSWVFTLTNNDGNKFEIGPANALQAGSVTTNYATSSTETISVSATNGIDTLTASFVITIRSISAGGPLDDPATSIHIAWVNPFISGQVVESTSVGTVIATLTATPGNSANQVFSESADVENAVAVAADGTITLDTTLNYALDNSHPFIVTVANAQASQSAGSLTLASAITVLNAAPVFVLSWAAGFEGGGISKDTAVGVTIGTFTALEGSGQTYAELSDPDGVITVSGTSLKLGKALDASVAVHPFIVRGTDSAGTFDLARYIVVLSTVDTIADIGFNAIPFRRDALIGSDAVQFYPIYGSRNTAAAFAASAFNRNAVTGTPAGAFS